MKLEQALELLISPEWRELSVGAQTLGQWVAGRKVRLDRCPFGEAVELRVSQELAALVPELQVRADALSFDLWQRLGLPLNSRANLCVDHGLHSFEYCILWQGQLLYRGLAAERADCVALIQAVEQSLETNAARLLGKRQLDEWLRLLARRHPKLVALARRRLERDELQWVLQALLDERASIRRLDVILTVLLDLPTSPLEAVRLAVAGDMVAGFASEYLNTIQILPRVERRIAAGDFREFLELLHREMAGFPGRRDIALLCRHDLRFRLRRRVREFYPDLAVISFREVVLARLPVNCIAILRTPTDKQRREEFVVRYDRARMRRKESHDEARVRLRAESRARAIAPFI